MYTSSATTSLPPARLASMCVMWEYPAGETWHSPSVSPSAASKPAETAKLSVKAPYTRVAGLRLYGQIRTNDEFRGEFNRDRHDYALEGMDVVGVRHASLRPGDVDRAFQL